MTAIAGIRASILVDRSPIPDRELGIFWSDGDWNAAEVLAPPRSVKGFSAWPRSARGRHRRGARGPTRFVPAIATFRALHRAGPGARAGRGFLKGEDAPGAAGVAVLSDLSGASWARSHLVGKTLLLGGQRERRRHHASRFWFPDPGVRLWLSDTLTPEQIGQYALIAAGPRTEVDVTGLIRISRRRRGSSPPSSPIPPEWDKTKNPTLVSLREHLVGSMRPSLMATVRPWPSSSSSPARNVAALMLGQVESRSGELAVRTALGADRVRLHHAAPVRSAGPGSGRRARRGGGRHLGFDVLRRALPSANGWTAPAWTGRCSRWRWPSR